MWLTSLAAPRHVGSSQTRARTRVPCIGRQTLSHCATREAPVATSLSPNLYNPLHLDVHPYTKIAFIKVTRKFHLSTCSNQFLLLILLIAQQQLTYFPLALRPPHSPGFPSFLSDDPTCPFLSSGAPQSSALSPHLFFLTYLHDPPALHLLQKF